MTNKIHLPVFLILLINLINSQPLCYTSCPQGKCNQPIQCAQCRQGQILLSNKCMPIGSQGQPLYLLNPQNNNSLNLYKMQNYINRDQIQCWSNNNPNSKLLYLNVTTTSNLIYTLRLPSLTISSQHQFINVRLNAILFNNNLSPSLNILIISQNKRLYNQLVNSNQPQSTCNLPLLGQTAVGKAFYVDISLQNSLRQKQQIQIFIQISTIVPGDQLGISNVKISYGNCYQGCSTCLSTTNNSCLSCNNFLLHNSNLNRCQLCPQGMYQVRHMCLICPYNCKTCTFNTSLGRPVCNSCQDFSNQQNNCQNQYYIDQSLKSLRKFNSSGWNSTQTLQSLNTLCGNYPLIGGIPYGLGGSKLAKVFQQLPVHNQISLKFSLLLIDQQTGTNFNYSIFIDQIQIVENNQINIDSSIMKTNQCGNQKQQYLKIIKLQNIQHKNNTLKFQFMGLGNYFGIRDLTLIVHNLTSIINCSQTDPNNANICIRCKDGLLLNNNKCQGCPQGYFMQNQKCQICSIICKTCNGKGSDKCTSCDYPLQFDTQSQTCIDNNNVLYTKLINNYTSQINQSSILRQWQFYPRLQNNTIFKCNQQIVIGSQKQLYRQLNIKRKFSNLPQHTGLVIHLMFYQIDNQVNQNQNINFRLDNLNIPYNKSLNGFQMCGNQNYDSLKKVILNYNSHNSQQLQLSIVGKGKFAINNVLIFLISCLQCQSNFINYKIQTIPMYSVQSIPLPTQRGLKSKLVFQQQLNIINQPDNIFRIVLVNKTSQNNIQKQLIMQLKSNNNFSRGQNDRFKITDYINKSGRQLILYQNLIKDQYQKKAVSSVIYPQLAFTPQQNQRLPKIIKIQAVQGQFSRYDDIYSIMDTQGVNPPQYRANIKNLMNFFRGITILALFIGLISFFFGLSQLFDDLFIMCQIIFIHNLIYSSWLPVSMKVPIGAMNLVQFMAWLPIQGRNAIQKGIIPNNHYQYSPIVFEQYWVDITFARAIYHTVIFLAAMFVLYWIIRLIKSLRSPTINNIMQLSQKRQRYLQRYYYNYINHRFVFIDKIVRYTFFTVVWSCLLQFIRFKVQPNSFMAWNSTLCILFFVVYILYIFIGYFYLVSRSKLIQSDTYKQKLDGIRIKQRRKWYFIVRYIKYLLIAILVSQLYYANPLSILIPLIIIHLIDATILIIFKPHIQDSGQNQRIVSKCSKKFWKYYNYSHVIQNILFFILQIIMIIIWAISGSSSKKSYISAGYAASAFVVILIVNALIRIIWNFIRIFQVCIQDIQIRKRQIKSDNDIGPLKYLDLYRANQSSTNIFNTQRKPQRRPSIQIKI